MADKPRMLTLADFAPMREVEAYRMAHGGRLPDFPLDPPPTEGECYWCGDCRATDCVHCANPGECSGMEILPLAVARLRAAKLWRGRMTTNEICSLDVLSCGCSACQDSRRRAGITPEGQIP